MGFRRPLSRPALNRNRPHCWLLGKGASFAQLNSFSAALRIHSFASFVPRGRRAGLYYPPTQGPSSQRRGGLGLNRGGTTKSTPAPTPIYPIRPGSQLQRPATLAATILHYRLPHGVSRPRSIQPSSQPESRLISCDDAAACFAATVVASAAIAAACARSLAAASCLPAWSRPANNGSCGEDG